MVIGNTLMFVVFLELRCSISTRLFDSIPIFWNHTDTNEILTLAYGPYLFVLYFHIIPSVHAYIRIIVNDSEK